MVEEQSNNEISVSGTCAQVHGLGILLTGLSGAGKSECALGLVAMGHRFVGDDVVRIRRVREVLRVTHAKTIGTVLHVRNVGLIDINKTYGKRCVAKDVELSAVIEIVTPLGGVNEITLGDETNFTSILGVSIPSYKINLFPGRAPAVVVDALVRELVYRRRFGGASAAKLLNRTQMGLAS